MIVLDVGGSESMGVVWDLIVTRVAGNDLGQMADNFGSKGDCSEGDLQDRRRFDGRFMPLLFLWLCLSFSCF